jgi:excisionase family DNA binding protein
LLAGISQSLLRGETIHPGIVAMLLTKEEAATKLGCKVRTLELYVQQGKLAVQYTKGKRGKLAQYDEIEVEALRHQLQQPGDYAQRPMLALSAANPATLATAFASNPLFELLTNAMPTQHAPVAIESKAFLTEIEAAALSGLGRSQIKAAIKDGKLKGHNFAGTRGKRIRRTDLDAWLKKL